MAKSIKPYLRLMRQLIDGEMEAQEFKRNFIAAYKSDSTRWKDDVANVLDSVFASADCYVDDPNIREDLRKIYETNDLHLDEKQLVEEVRGALKSLETAL